MRSLAMALGTIFCRRPHHSNEAEPSFSGYAAAPDMRTHGLHGGDTSHGRLVTSSRHARHPRPYGAALSANPPPAFATELSGQDSGSILAQNYHDYAPSRSSQSSTALFGTSRNYPQHHHYHHQHQRQQQQQQQQYSTFSTRISSSQAPSQSPTCRECQHSLTLHYVRNDRNGRLGRPYYRCERCGEFRAWADMQGVDQSNPDCQCGEPSRLEESNAGIPYFTCVRGRCGFYSEGDWRESAGQEGGGYWGGGSGDACGGRVEMA